MGSEGWWQKYQIRNQVNEALFQPPPLTHSSMWACIFCTILFFFLFLNFNLIEIIKSLGLGTVCQLTSAPCPDRCMSGVGTWEGGLGWILASLLDQRQGKCVVAVGAAGLCKSGFSNRRVCFLGNCGVQDALFIIHSRSHVQGELVAAARRRHVLFSFDTAQNHLTILLKLDGRKETENTQERFASFFLSICYQKYFWKWILNPYPFIGKFRKLYLPQNLWMKNRGRWHFDWTTSVKASGNSLCKWHYLFAVEPAKKRN